MSRQVDVDLLADYVGGALDGSPEAQRVADLISTSPEWRRAADDLTAALHAVRHDLSALGEQPETMPQDIADRFDDLFASPALDHTTSPVRDPLAQRGITRHGGRRRRWHRWAAPVAIAAGAAAFFALGGLPSVTGTSMNDAGAPEHGEALTYSESVSALPTIDAGRRYTRATLKGPGRASVDSPGAKIDVVPGMRDNTIGELYRLREPNALRACLEDVAAALPGKATLVEYAYFEDRPALVISITARASAATPAAEWKFVAGRGCGLTGPEELYRTPLQ